MASNKYLSLSEMAERFNISAKTFAKYVENRGIPYYPFGRTKRFDPCEVAAYMRMIPEPPEPSNVVQIKPVRKQRKQKKSRFAEACGV